MPIKLATQSDIENICLVQRKSWQHVYSPYLVKKMFKVLPSSLHQKLWQQRVSNDNNQVWVLKNPQLEGLLMLEKQADEIELAALYLLPKTIGKGWGRAMLKHACQQANVKQLHCWVMQDNEHAEGFYRHLGFTFDGELRKVAFSGSDFMQKKAHLATDSRFF